MKHKQRIARATEKHATLLYKTGKKTIEVTQGLSHKTNVILKDGLETKGIDKEITWQSSPLHYRNTWKMFMM